MKRVLLSAILSTYVFSGFSQTFSKNYEIELSESYEELKAKSEEFFSIEDGNSTLSVKTDGETVLVQKTDLLSMKESARNVIADFPDKSYAIETVKIDEKTVIYFYTCYNDNSKTFTVNARKLNVKDCSMSEPVKLLETSKKIIGQLYELYDENIMPTAPIRRFLKFGVRTSFDCSKLMINYRRTPEVSGVQRTEAVYGLEVFDSQNLSKLWSEEVTLPYTEKEMVLNSFWLDNQGKVNLLIGNKIDNNYSVLTYHDGTFNQVTLDLDHGLFLQKLEIRELPSGNIAFAGLNASGIEHKFSSTGFDNELIIDGYYTFTLGKDLNLLNKHKETFTLDFIKQNLSARHLKEIISREKNGKAGLNGLKLDNFHIDNDGNFILVCEQQFTSSEQWSNYLQNRIYRYSNCVIIKTTSEGKIIWIKKLPKNQGTTGVAKLPYIDYKGTLGMKYMSYGQEHYIVYLDNKKNEEVAIDEEPSPFKYAVGGIIPSPGGVFTVYRVNDEAGEVSKEMLFEPGKINGVKVSKFEIRKMFNNEKGQLLMELDVKRKQDAMVKLEFIKR